MSVVPRPVNRASPRRAIGPASLAGLASLVGLAAPLGAAAELITTLGGVEIAEVGPNVMPGADAATAVIGATEIDLEGLMDKYAEIEPLGKRREEVQKNVRALAGRLANPAYASKAPPHLVKQTQDALAEGEKGLATVTEKIKGLGVGG